MGVAGLFAGCAEQEEDVEVMAAAPAAPAAEEAVTWSYAGETGPEAWGALSGEFEACAAGMEQSPIALQTAAAARSDLSPLDLEYVDGAFTVSATDHGFVATPAADGYLGIGADRYRLLQFHLHTPSEHTLDGVSYPAEIHYVHQNEAGQLAVVGVMVEEGPASTAMEGFVEAVRQGGSDFEVSADALFPEERGYFTYAGSLTTPPCSEGVRWQVLAEPITMSAEQIAALTEAHGTSNRPVQPLADRELRVSGT